MEIHNAQRGAAGDGLRHLIEARKVDLDKAPVLQAMFERLSFACSDSMRELCATPRAFKFDSMTSGATLELLDAYRMGFGAVFSAPEWNARIVIGCDRQFTTTMVEAMFGSDGSEASGPVERPLTTLEASAMRVIMTRTADALRLQLASFCATTLAFERAETALDVSTIRMPDVPALCARLTVNVMGRDSRLFVLIPQSALSSCRGQLEQQEPREKPRADPVWSQQLQIELGRTEVDACAVLEGPQLTLEMLSRLQPGQLLKLSASANAPINLEVEDRVLFTAKLAQSKGLFTVRIEDRVDERERALSEIFVDQAESAH